MILKWNLQMENEKEENAQISPDSSKELENLKQNEEKPSALSDIPPSVLLDELSRRIGTLPPKEAHRIERRIEQHFSGPIPPPHILAKYEEISGGGFANRIVTMAEKEQSHRHSVDDKMVSGAVSIDARGQNYAFILCRVGAAQ